MRLYLMQHALAYSSAEDSERPLNPDGVKQAKQSASGIKRLGLDFDLIMTSPKRRAQQTAALVAEAVRYPYSDIMTTEALLPDQTPDGLLELLQKESTESRILVVGHLPHLARLADLGGHTVGAVGGDGQPAVGSGHPHVVYKLGPAVMEIAPAAGVSGMGAGADGILAVAVMPEAQFFVGTLRLVGQDVVPQAFQVGG